MPITNTIPEEKRFVFYDNPELDTCYYNPVSLPRGRRNVLRLSSDLLQATNISVGLRYGEWYFALDNLCRMLSVHRILERQGKNVTLREIAAVMKQQNEKDRFRDATMIRNAVELLRAFRQIDIDGSEPEEKTLNFDRLLDEKKHAYAWLPLISNIAARQIATTMLCSLLAAQEARIEMGLPPHHVWVVIDEAPALISQYFAAWLANIRKPHTTPIVIAQDSSQFDEENKMLKLLRKVARFQCFYDATLEEAEYIAGRSLDKIVKLHGSVDDPHSFRPTDNWREVMMPSFSLNKIRRISGERNHAILLWDFNGHFSNPSQVVIPYVSRTLEEYERLESRPLPCRLAPQPQPAPAPTSGN